MMTCYVVRASSSDFVIDEFEIKKAKWIPITDLIDIIKNNKKTTLIMMRIMVIPISCGFKTG